jgi:hypothetical protein
MNDQEQDLMPLEDIQAKLEELQTKHAATATETLAAHWIVPLLIDLTEHVQNLDEYVDEIEENRDGESSPASVYSDETIDAVKTFLFRLGYQSWQPDKHGKLPQFVVDARSIFVQMGSDEEGITPEEFAVNLEQYIGTLMQPTQPQRPSQQESPTPVQIQSAPQREEIVPEIDGIAHRTEPVAEVVVEATGE